MINVKKIDRNIALCGKHLCRQRNAANAGNRYRYATAGQHADASRTMEPASLHRLCFAAKHHDTQEPPQRRERRSGRKDRQRQPSSPASRHP